MMWTSVGGLVEAAPSPERVARRALALTAIICRGSIESGAGDPRAEEMREATLRWLARLGADRELSAEETDLLSAPLGALTPGQRAACVWKTERLIVLAWALGRTLLPEHDEQAHPRLTARQLGFLSDKGARLIDGATLHERRDLLAYADVAAVVLERLRAQVLRPGPVDFAAFARRHGIHDVRGVPRVGGDLRVGAVAVHQADAGDLERALCTGVERHTAATWLRGGPEACVPLSVDA